MPGRGQWTVREIDEDASATDQDFAPDAGEDEREDQEEEGNPIAGRRHSPSGLDKIVGVGVEAISTGNAHNHRRMMKLLHDKFEALFARSYVPCMTDCGIFDDCFIWGEKDCPTMVPIAGQFHFALAGFTILWVRPDVSMACTPIPEQSSRLYIQLVCQSL